LIAAGQSNSAIAERLALSEKTIRNNVSSIFAKLQVADRPSANSVISFVAGLLAVGVALFPTNAPHTVLTTIAKLHVAFAALLFVLLGVICFPLRQSRWKARGSFGALAYHVENYPSGLRHRHLGRRCRKCRARRTRV
jgi:hypothetical protein